MKKFLTLRYKCNANTDFNLDGRLICICWRRDNSEYGKSRPPTQGPLHNIDTKYKEKRKNIS
jgi:hypothetical protein